MVEAWLADLVRLSHAQRRARRLRTELDSRSAVVRVATAGQGSGTSAPVGMIEA